MPNSKMDQLCTLTTEYYVTMRFNEHQLQATIWMNLTNMVCERTRVENSAGGLVQLYKV